jgi:uncharacterized protein YraI
MKYLKLVAGLAVALAALPGVSQAQLAYAAKQVNLRAGPGMEYPVIAILLAGVPVTVQGCVADYRWCDVEAGPSRGWVYAGNIVYPYQGANVPVISSGAMIGIGILAYSVASYWDQHYVGRPWYPQRQRWINRPPPPPHAPPVQRPALPEHHAPSGQRPVSPEHRAPSGQRPGPHVAPPEARPHGVTPVAPPQQREQRPVQQAPEPRAVHRGPKDKEQGPPSR